MIPRIDISVPDVFIRAFYNPRTYGPREKLDADIENFKSFFKENGDRILQEIESLSGFFWNENRIPVYLLPDGMFSPVASFATSNLEGELSGIVQKIGRPGVRDIHVHIHELSHVNQWQGGWRSRQTGYALKQNGEWNTDLVELGADLVTIYVIRNIFGIDSVYEKDFWDFLQNTNERNKRKNDVLKSYIDLWDLNQNPLKYYLEQASREKLDNLL